MKKIFIFLITILFLLPFTTKAENIRFYEGDYKGKIYLDRVFPDRSYTYYQRSREFLNNKGEYAYCLEPFILFNEDSTYTSGNTKLSKEQIRKISLLAHFGYMYEGHNADKWYAVTQILIWQVVDPDGDYFFTDKLNGERINIYTDEMKEVKDLVANYEKTPSFTNNKYKIVAGNTLELIDDNYIINNYTTNNPNVTIEDNKVIIKDLNPGKYNIRFTRESPIFTNQVNFYESPNSQDMVTIGNIDDKNIKLTVTVEETSITINKLDQDNKTTTPRGEAKLIGTSYKLYNENNEVVQDIKILSDEAIIIKNLNYGKYYLKEIEAGNGYNLDQNTYEIILSEENPNITLDLYNKVIEAEITINKKYLVDQDLLPEKDIKFSIYNRENELIDTITTDNNGTASITLPYGFYTIKQINTSPNYTKIDDFDIIISNNEPLIYNLTNYKIEVPDTGMTRINYIIKIITQWLYII